MKFAFFLVFLGFLSFASFAQNGNVDESEYDENYEFKENKLREFSVNVGLGLGLDYGGIGGRISFVPIPNLAVFGSVGYNFNGAGYNGGLIYRVLPAKKVCPYVSAMYGYNAVILIDGVDDANKTYYGMSFGAGIELHKRDKPNFWNFGFTVPIRSQEYKDRVDALANDPNIDFTEGLPFSISVGYHFGL